MGVVLTDFTKKGNGVPGMSEKLYMCLKDQIIMPATVNPVADPGDRFRLAADITFKDNAHGWVEVYTTKDTVELMLDRVGAKDSKQWKAEAKFFVPTIDPQWTDILFDDPDVVIAMRRPDCGDAEWIVLGDECKALELSAPFNSGNSANEGDRHGFEVMVHGHLPKFYYYPDTNEFIAPGWV